MSTKLVPCVVVFVDRARAVITAVSTESQVLPHITTEEPALSVVSVVPVVPITESLIPRDFQHLFHYDRRYNVLTCIICKIALAKTTLPTHLSKKHIIPHDDKKWLFKAVEHVMIAKTIDNLKRPDDLSDPVIGLNIIDLYSCKICRHFSPSPEGIYRHFVDKHREAQHGRKFTGNWSLVKTQQWTITGRGAKGWSVRVGTDDTVTPSVQQRSSWKERVLQEEYERQERQRQDRSTGRAGNNADDASVWLLFTLWPQRFEGKNLGLLAETRHYRWEPEARKMFPNWPSKRMDLISSSFDKVVVRAKLTLDDTSDMLRCWVRSIKPDEPFRRPFRRLQLPESEEGYARQWKQFLYYSLRISQLDQAATDKHYGIVCRKSTP
jgi:Orsellinic acid/F9775 biosynthesis cluster protein D